MIREDAALQLARDLLPHDAEDMLVRLAASLIVKRVQLDEIEKENERLEAEIKHAIESAAAQVPDTARSGCDVRQTTHSNPASAAVPPIDRTPDPKSGQGGTGNVPPGTILMFDHGVKR